MQPCCAVEFNEYRYVKLSYYLHSKYFFGFTLYPAFKRVRRRSPLPTFHDILVAFLKIFNISFARVPGLKYYLSDGIFFFNNIYFMVINYILLDNVICIFL